MTTPDPQLVLDLMYAFRGSKVMFTATRLGVFDRLEAAPATVDALAMALNVSEDALERLLDAAVALGLLERSDAGVYSNTAVASGYLTRASATTLAGYVLFSEQALYPMWGHLDDAVREGTNRWTQTFGLRDNMFEHFFADPESMRTFLLGLHGYGVISSPKVAAAFDLGRFRRMVDLGGGSGHLAIAACERYPALRAAVFELPRVIEFAREMAGRSPAADRIDILAGDFFADELPPADLYAAGQIVHDWSEPKIARLLEKVARALPSGGGLLLAEKLLDSDKRGPAGALYQSLNMLICTEGRERTLDEYAALLHKAGFGEVKGQVTGARVDAILAIKP
jgi:acetylserotonin N-methyltransferase